MLFLSTLLLSLAPAPGFDEPSRPQDGVFVLKNVSVWQPGGAVQGRTLILRNGLIEGFMDAGQSFSPPPEARVIEAGEDWILYPGWIHAQFPEGMGETPGTPFQSTATSAATGPLTAMEWGNRKDLRGWYQVAQHLNWDPDKGSSWRKLGFTSAHLIPRQGLICGQAAWLSLNSLPAGEAILQTAGHLALSLRPSRGGYPGTQMAGLATLRQAFADADRLRRLTGRSRLHPDPDLAALQARPDLPLLFHASSAREIENALDLMAEFGQNRRLILVGGRDAHKLSDRLVRAGTQVLFRLDLDEAPKSDEDLKIKAAEERPYWQEPQRAREDRHRLYAEHVRRFVSLRDAGVPCALVPGDSAKKFYDDLKILLDHGMEPDEVLAAVSTDLAKILGLSKVGNLGPGQAADFFVHRGEWSPKDTDIAWVFADGRGWEFPEKPQKEKKKDSEKDQVEAKPESNQTPGMDLRFDGVWAFELNSPMGEIEFDLNIDQKANTIKIQSEEMPGGSVDAKKVQFSETGFQFEFGDPSGQFEVKAKVTVSGDTATALMSLPDPIGDLTATGKRQPDQSHNRTVDLAAAKKSDQESNSRSRSAETEIWEFEFADHAGRFWIRRNQESRKVRLWHGWPLTSEHEIRIEGSQIDTAQVRLQFAQPGTHHCASGRDPHLSQDWHFDFLPENKNFAFELAIDFAESTAQATLLTPFGPASASGHAKIPAGEDKEEKKPAHPLGHPEWLVETALDRLPGKVLAGDVLLQGATLYPMTGDAPFVGDLYIASGLIAGMTKGSANWDLPWGVPVVDATGWHITPAVIDPHSHLSLDSVNDGSVSITAECRIEDMIRPEGVGIYRAAAGGTAVNQSLHGSANPIGGQAAVWELDVNRSTIRSLVIPDTQRGIKFALGENVKRSNWGGRGGGNSRFPSSRSGVQAVYRRAFTAAQDYARERERYRQGLDPTFRRDVRLDVLADILDNNIHIQIHSYRADEIFMFVEICKEFGIQRPTFQHILEGYKVAPEMAAIGAMASSFSDWWAYKFEVYDAIPWNPYLMTKAGVISTINSDSGEMIRRLNTEAGKSLRYGGLSYEDSLALCTKNAAIQLRLEDRMGTLEVGKFGSVSVFDAPPLSTYARCVLTLARGKVLFDWDPQHDAAWNQYVADVKKFADENRKETPASLEMKTSLASWERWTRAGQGKAYFIYNAKIHPVSRPAFDGAILMENGRITWLGEGIRGNLPDHCEAIDANGRHVYPGFIESANQLGLYEVGTVSGSIDHRESGSYQPDLSVAAAIHPDSVHHRVHRMNGITHALSHMTSGVIAGQPALIQLDGETWEEMAVEPDFALHIRFPRVRAEEGKAPKDPDELKELTQWIRDAHDYAARQERFKKAGRTMPERNLKLEALVPFIKGAKPVLIEAGGTHSLLRAHQWAAEHELDAIYMAGRDSWKVAGILGAHNSRLILGPVHTNPGSYEPFDAAYRNAGVLDQAGCRVALKVDDPETARNLPFQAATAAAHGWSRERALRSITLGAAEVLGVETYTGSLDVGKAANLFLSKGDPMDFKGEVIRMWIGGKEVDLNSKQSDLRDRYEARIDRLRKD